MKKLVFLFFALAMMIRAASQTVVTDPALTQLAIEEAADRQVIKAKSIQQLAESILQTQELEKAYELAKRGYDALVEVNELLQDLEMIQRSIERQQKLVEKTQNMINDFGRDDIFSVEEYRKITDNMIDLIDGCTDIIEMFNLVIERGKTKMNDAERMSLIIEIEKNYNEKHAVTLAKLTYYEDVRERRQALRAMEDMARKMNE